MKKRYTEEQIIKVIKQHEAGAKVDDICTHDLTCRFTVGDYVCTSNIVEILPNEHSVKTFSGNIYLVEGDGEKSEMQIQHFELLRHGFSPSEICLLKSAADKYN